jgi:hypothetical protein
LNTSPLITRTAVVVEKRHGVAGVVTGLRAGFRVQAELADFDGTRDG